jgi:hypothetical protein
VALEAYFDGSHEGGWIDGKVATLAGFTAGWPGIIDSAHFFFDQGEPFKDPFEQRWEKKRTLA